MALTGLLVALTIRWAQPAAPPGPDGKPRDFQRVLRDRSPRYADEERPCPVCGQLFMVPMGLPNSGNMFGGVGTDSMPVALGAPPEGEGAPQLDCQDYDKLLVGCPSCRACFNGLDHAEYSGGSPFNALSNLRGGWKIETAAPALKDKPIEAWTLDERAFVRYLTRSTAWRGEAGADIELSFAALDGASTTNMSIYLGRDYHIPAAAFYALCAAHCRLALAAQPDLPERNARGAAMLAMQLGECSRLLGRDADSAAAFGQAEEWIQTSIATAQEQLEAARREGKKQAEMDQSYLLDTAKGQHYYLKQLAGYLKDGDRHLHRLKARKERRPPVGWYIELMLPAINGELDSTREAWTQAREPGQIVEQINAMLAQ